jgi:hypothetical protein
MTAVKVGQQRRYNQGDQREFRVIAVCDGVALCSGGMATGIDYLAEHSTVLPPRDGEYVEGEAVEVLSGEGVWVSATYMLEFDSWHFCYIHKSRPQAYVSAEVRRPRPKKTKWVVPTQADLDAATGPIPCRIRDAGKWTGEVRHLHGIAKWTSDKFIVMGGFLFNFRDCVIEVPESDPRPGVEVEWQPPAHPDYRSG